MNIEIASTGIYNGISQTRTPGIIGVLGNILRIPISLLLMPIYGVFGVWIAVSLLYNKGNNFFPYSSPQA